MEYKKLTDKTFEVTETRKIVVDIDNLYKEKDGLERTLAINAEAYQRETDKINSMLASINAAIAEAEKMGVQKTVALEEVAEIQDGARE